MLLNVRTGYKAKTRRDDHKQRDSVKYRIVTMAKPNLTSKIKRRSLLSRNPYLFIDKRKRNGLLGVYMVLFFDGSLRILFVGFSS